MQVIESVNDMQSSSVALRSEGKLIGLVPTSGFLHAGHRSLMEKAREQVDRVVVSIFVNPREFGPNEDFRRYPRDRERDLALCAEAGVDTVFIPSEAEMYPAGYASSVTEEKRSAGLCGPSRPHYFKGACTVFAKLINIVRPDALYLGWRDAQLAAVVRKMVEDLNFPVDILLGETVRDPEGLALSARNEYLNDFQRRDAVLVYKALCQGKALVESGILNVDRILAEVTHHIAQSRRLRVIYVSAVDPETMEPRREIVPGNTLVATAVWCDEVRLLDNILL